MYESEEMKKLRREMHENEPEPQQATEEPEPSGGSRYKRGRRWWEQSKWERRR